MSVTARAEIGKLAFQDGVLTVRKTNVVTLRPLGAIVHSACAVGIKQGTASIKRLGQFC